MERDTNPVIDMNNKIIQEKIELSIKLMNNITIPAIVLEYKMNDNLSFNLDDLKQLYTHFGNVLNIILLGKKNIVLFKTFFSAFICKLFLENKDNYKNNIFHNFTIRWFDLNLDHQLLPVESKELFMNINNANIMKMNVNNNSNNINDISIGVKMDMNLNNLNLNMNNNQLNEVNNMFNPLIPNNMNNLIGNYNRNILEYNNINNIIGMQTPNLINNNENIFMNGKNINNNNLNLNTFNNINNNIGIINNYNNFNNYNNINVINNMNNISNINNLNININDNFDYRMFNRNNNYNQYNNNINIKNVNLNEDKISGKYTCKYEILIENDSEFQIARRLIGSKGINMKKIINECKKDGERETVKLRLRGKGSGYKEGPQNKESDEPLHLCISAKTKEEMNKACFLVNKLLEKTNEDYKLFCKKYGKKPKSDKIARKMENDNINFNYNNKFF